jgi:hypothetical protein
LGVTIHEETELLLFPIVPKTFAHSEGMVIANGNFDRFKI